jgi:hypothetical protein
MRGKMDLAAGGRLRRARRGSSSAFGWESTLGDAARLLDSYVAKRAQSNPLALPVA